MPTRFQTAAAMMRTGYAYWLPCCNEESQSDISIPLKKRVWATRLQQLTEMSKSSSVSSNMRTLMVTCRPGGMARGLCPGSSVLMPRVSGAPRRCTAPEAIGCGSGSAMLAMLTAQPARKPREQRSSKPSRACSHSHSARAQNNATDATVAEHQWCRQQVKDNEMRGPASVSHQHSHWNAVFALAPNGW